MSCGCTDVDAAAAAGRCIRSVGDHQPTSPPAHQETALALQHYPTELCEGIYTTLEELDEDRVVMAVLEDTRLDKLEKGRLSRFYLG